jgi:hypothetical protein
LNLARRFVVWDSDVFLGGTILGRLKDGEELMRRYRLSLVIALALSGLVYCGSNASAQTWCAVQYPAHSKAKILLNHKTIATCTSGAAGCKCVSCYQLNGSVASTCYSLL